MKARHVIETLQALIAAHGDIEVYLEDPDTGALLDIELGYNDLPDSKGYRLLPKVPHLAIMSGYDRQVPIPWDAADGVV
jgi:hypothetical protein